MCCLQLPLYYPIFHAANGPNAVQVMDVGMSRRKGYQIDKREGKRGVSYRARIWVPSSNSYGESRTFTTLQYGSAREAKRAGERWARERAAQHIAGVIETQCAGQTKTAELIDMYVADRTTRGGNATQLANVKRRLRDLPRHCPNLSARDAGKHVYGWWLAWCEEPCQIGGRADQVLPRTTTGKAKSIRTRNNGLTDMKAFVHWCHKARQLTGLTQAVDVDWIEKLREEQTVKPQFTIDELRAGLSMVDHDFHIRWALYLYLGARAQEALRLSWDDISGDHILLSGKGRKQRLVPLQTELIPILEAYKKDHNYDGYLFQENYRRGQGDTVKRFDNFLNAAGIEKNGRSTHSLRHCYAGLMTATGEPTALLQAYMGHSQSDMTRHYAQFAARYRSRVGGWSRGALQIVLQWHESWPRE